MALKGTLGDFSLADILQLIGLQRKTGVLVVRRGGEEVSIAFDAGRVVAADSSSRPVEDRVGGLLVRTGRLTDARLQRALEIQKETLERLGRVLASQGWVEQEAIRRQLTLQITETVYELFRWPDGEYDFQPGARVEWDQEFITPINCEHLMMEGAQMVDEWPLIERVIPTRTVVLRPTKAADEILATASSQTSEVRGSVYEDDIDFGFITDPLAGDADKGKPKLTQREIHVLRWVDGQRTAIEIADLTELGSFEAFKTLAKLSEQKLIESVDLEEEVQPSLFARVFRSQTPARALGLLLVVVALAGTVVAVQGVVQALWPSARLLPLPEPLIGSTRWLAAESGLPDLRHAASAARLRVVEDGVEVFYLTTGRWPTSLREVVSAGILPARVVRDPQGRDYRYRLESWGFRLSEADPNGGYLPLTRERRFGPMERGFAPN